MTQETEHTPGPWRLFESASGDYYHVMQADDLDISRVALVEVFGPVNDRDADMEVVGKANARLIAAAPDMLNALLCVADELNSHPEQGRWLGEKVRAAIAKAKGE